MARIRILLPFLIAMMFSGSALAYVKNESIHVDVTGTIVAPACQVDVPQSVDLGQIARQLITVPGSNSSTKTLTIKLSQCSSVTSKATLTFSGPSYTADPDLASVIYANDLPDGTSGVGLQLFNIDGKPLMNLGNGTSYNLAINTQTASAELPLAARLYTPHGNPTPGDFHSSVTINFIYQ